MPVIAAARRPSSMSKLYVYIDRPGADLHGRLYTTQSELPFIFNSLLDFMKQADALFNTLSFPQSTYESRQFPGTRPKISDQKSEVPVMAQGSISVEHDNKATFIIHVKYRQNATWQGEIKWVNKNKTQYFRSDLEMIKLIDAALAEDYGEEIEVEWK